MFLCRDSHLVIEASEAGCHHQHAAYTSLGHGIKSKISSLPLLVTAVLEGALTVNVAREQLI